MKTIISPLTPEGGISKWHNDNGSLHRWIIKALCLFCMFLTNVVVHAQSEDDQLLIFRNTGETNLLYQSQIDSITFTKIDTLGVEYEEPIAQIFHTADTTLYVSIAEIDSVCLGSRNMIEYRADVRVLADDPDMQWIIRYDGDNIYYKTSTPSDVLPTEGQKLYFTEQTEMFPCGLCARVDEMVRKESEIAVAVSSIDATEVFKKFFYAGSLEGIKQEIANAKPTRAKEIDKGETVKFTLDLDGRGELAVDGRIGVHGDVIIDLWKHYYHADMNIENVFGLSVKANAKESAQHSFEKEFLHIPLPTVAALFQPSIDIGGFVDLNAELSFEYAMDRKITTRIEWTRKGGKQSFKRRNPSEYGAQGNQAKLQVMLNGGLYLGLMTSFNFALVGDIVGATARIKWGPEFSGELGMQLLNDLSKDYDVDLQGKAELNLRNKMLFEGLVTHRSKWIMGDIIVTPVLSFEHLLSERKIDLFPKFFAPRAVVSPSKKDLSVAVKSSNEIAHDVKTGFQIVKSEENPEPLKTEFVKNIEAKPNIEVQGVDASIDIPNNVDAEKGVFLRPVFKYAGYTIPHSIMRAAQNPNFQPVIFEMSNGAATLVSGIPMIDNKKVDKTLYNTGPFVALIEKNDTVFHEESPYVGIGENHGYIYYEDWDVLTGQWEGIIDGRNISVTFASDGTGIIKSDNISITDGQYFINKPQGGNILIESKDVTIIMEVISLSGDSIEIKFKNGINKGKKCRLSRK